MLQEEKRESVLRGIIRRKQIIDFLGLGLSFLILITVIAFTSLHVIGMVITAILMFVVCILTLEITRKLTSSAIRHQIINAVDTTNLDVKKIENIATNQKNGINSIVLKLTNFKNALGNMKEFMTSLNEQAQQTYKKTEESIGFSHSENLAVKANIDKMFMIRHKIQTIAELILELSEFIQSISSTIGVVKDIAEQTNLLALNAAVEAARAGEHGKGFAVVAGEIRKLADESKQATTRITSLITDIQQAANSTVMATEEGTKEIESGIGLAQSIDKNIEALINLINEISLGTRGVMSASDKLGKDILHTDKYIDELDSMLEQSSQYAEENSGNIEHLSAVSRSFRESI